MNENEGLLGLLWYLQEQYCERPHVIGQCRGCEEFPDVSQYDGHELRIWIEHGYCANCAQVFNEVRKVG